MMKKKYEWRELTNDGLLKKPEPFGPYYNEVDVNGYDGFEKEEDAVNSYYSLKEAFPYLAPWRLVLITFYEKGN